VFLDNLANDGDTHANLEATDAVTFNPAFTYPYGHPGDSSRMHPVSSKCLIVNQSINLSCRITGRLLNWAHTNHDALYVAFFLLPWPCIYASQSSHRRRFHNIVTKRRCFMARVHSCAHASDGRAARRKCE
jgi:hypothetical protein